jgi:hypothetical protein
MASKGISSAVNKKAVKLIDLEQMVDHYGSTGLLVNLSKALMISCRDTGHEMEALEVIADNMPPHRHDDKNSAVRELRASLETRLTLLRERYQTGCS